MEHDKILRFPKNNFKIFGCYHHLTLFYCVSVTTMANESVDHDIVVMSTFLSLIRHRRHHDGCRMWSRKWLPFWSTWFNLWFS